MQKPDCGHWTPLKGRVGTCARPDIGGGGERPSLGYCLRVCELGPKLKHLTAGEVAHGAAGLAKAAAGIGRADQATIDARIEICKTCDRATLDSKGNLQSCSVCRCALWAKLSLAGEACPIGKWAAVK